MIRLSRGVFNPAAGFRFYPMNLIWFKDGLYGISVASEYRPALGARLLKIGEVDVEKARTAAARIISHENEAALKNISPGYLVTAEVLHTLGLSQSPDRARFTFEDAAGRFELEMTPLVRTHPIQWLTLPDPARVTPPLYLRKSDVFYWTPPERRTSGKRVAIQRKIKIGTNPLPIDTRVMRLICRRSR